MKIFNYLFVLILASCPVYGAVIHVPGSYPTIQAGIDAAANGDTVLVADGTYSGDGNRNMELRGKILTVISQNGPENCVINFEDSEYYEKGFYCHENETNLTSIQGFAFTNSTGSSYAIVCYQSSPIISNCIFAGCSGAALYMSSSDSRVIDCIFKDNASGNNGGGALCLRYSNVQILNCEITGNTAYQVGGGIFVDHGVATITDTEITGNTTILGGGGIYSHNCEISLLRCTIQDNLATQSGGGVYNAQSEIIVSDCIIKGNRASNAGGGVYSLSDLVITDCIIEDNHAQFGGGLFCDANYVNSVIGGSPDKTNTFRNNVAAAGADLCAPFVDSPLNAGYNLFAGNCLSDYFVSPASAFDLAGCTSESDLILQNVYVSPEGNDTNDGLTPETPFKTIRKALSSVYGTETDPITIYIMPGMYSSSQNGEKFPLPLVNHVNIHGEDESSVFINAEQTGRVFFGFRDTVTLSGMTITGGKMESLGNGPFRCDGGGIFALESSIGMNGCVVIENSVGEDRNQAFGGGIALNDSDLEMTDCIIYGNYAFGNGGGLYFSLYDREEVEMLLTDTQILENVTDESGGGLCFRYSDTGDSFKGSPELTGCTISRNVAKISGGGMYTDKFFHDHYPMRISQCTFSDNRSASSGGGILTSTDCIVTGTRFSGNRVSGNGSILSFTPRTHLEFVNCLITGNVSPSAVIQVNLESYSFGSGRFCTFFNTTVADNTVTKLDLAALNLITKDNFSTSLTNCILWNNAASEITIDAQEGGSTAVSYSCVKTGYPGTGNFQFDPGFAGGGDYHLKPDSACVDTGTDVGFPNTDIDSNNRPVGGNSDIGAYEYPGWPEALRIYVDMPGHEILSWDPFWVSLDVWNPYDQTLEGLPLFMILTVNGQYFFAPSFTDYDFYLPFLSKGMTKMEVIPQIYWPSAGSLNDVLWISAMTDPGVTSVLSNVAVYSFGWHD